MPVLYLDTNFRLYDIVDKSLEVSVSMSFNTYIQISINFRSTCAMIIALFLAGVFFIPFADADRGVPRIINHQGRLLDSSGNLLGGAGTDYCFRFSIYTDSAAGAPDTKLWPSGTPSNMTINVKQGVFNARIGDTAQGGDILDFDFQQNDEIYLNVEVADRVGADCSGGDEVFENLDPRNRILASAFAINAVSVLGNAQSAVGTTTPVSDAQFTAEATSSSVIAMAVRGFFNQVADLFRIIAATGEQLLTFTAGGYLGIG